MSIIARLVEDKKLFTAIIDNGKYISNTDLKHRCDSCLASLSWFRVKRGDVIAIETNFCADAIAWFFAAVEIGAVVVPLQNGDKDKDRKQEISEVNHIITKKEDETFYHHIRSTEEKKNPLYNCLENAGLVLFSSGTSGKPKATLHSMDRLLKKWTHKRKSETTYLALRWDHIGGINTMLHVLLNDGCLVRDALRSAKNVCKLIQEHKISCLPTTPTFLNLILTSGAYKEFDLKSLKTITYGTEPMPEITLSMLNLAMPWVKLKQTYGLTEIGILRSKSMSSNSTYMQVGGDGVETRIRDGKLEIKSETSMIGYLNDISPYTEDGWFMTGDLVEENGEYIKILGRESDLINCGGEKVYPAEVEDAIKLFENIEDCVVFGERSPLIGQMVCAKISVKDKNIDENLYKSKLNSHLNSVLDKYKIPMKVSIVASIGMTDRGKKDRSTC